MPLEDFIRESIVDPDAYVPPGFTAGHDAARSRRRSPPAELDALVQYLADEHEMTMTRRTATPHERPRTATTATTGITARRRRAPAGAAGPARAGCRVLWMTPLIGFIGLGIVCAIRWAADWDPIWYAPPLVTVALVTFPLGFLAGPRRASTTGSTTRPAGRRGPRTTPGHGAHSWRDYFRPNTDHKVIGVQYLVHDDLLLRRRRPAGDDVPRRAGRAGHAVLQPADVQRPRSRTTRR